MSPRTDALPPPQRPAVREPLWTTVEFGYSSEMDTRNASCSPDPTGAGFVLSHRATPTLVAGELDQELVDGRGEVGQGRVWGQTPGAVTRLTVGRHDDDLRGVG